MPDFQYFHFLSPNWLLAFIPMIGLIMFYRLRKTKQSSWNKVIQPHLLKHLLVENQTMKSRWALLLLLLGGAIGIISLANPVWEKKPQSVFETPTARVIVLDLSASMNAADLKPNRMKRARLKLQDILKRQTEGQTGLVVFAGDAFTVTPLSRDNDTILSQIMVLEPGIMPLQGSRLDLGLLHAVELFKQSGIPAGDILVIADGYNSPRVFDVAEEIAKQGHRISVLGIGTKEGAPISNGQGDVVRDKDNVPILSRLPEEAFVQLSEIGNGRYSQLSLDDSDIDKLLSLPSLNLDKQRPEQFMQQNQWQENGPYLALLLLPLAALAFRKGWLMSVFLFTLIIPLPKPTMAIEPAMTVEPDSFTWEDLWLTREQQASKALQVEDHEKAAALSSDPAVKGSALYRQQDYQQALNEFKQLNTADAHYNRGNTLAQIGQYEQAIKAYDEALKLQPEMQDAIDNRKAIQDFLNQQKQQQQEQQNQDQSQEDQQQQNQQQQNSEQNQQQEQQNQESQSQEQPPNPQNQQDQQEQQEDQQASESESAQSEDSHQENSQENQGQNNSLEDQPQQAESENKQDEPTGDEQQQDQQLSQSSDKREALEQRDFEAQPLTDEEEQAAQQWLRRIPDDPGDLLKRKFLYQYQHRQRQPSTMQPW